MNHDLGAYLAAAGSRSQAHSLAELVAFDQRTTAERTSPDNRDFISAAVGTSMDDPYYQASVAGCAKVSQLFYQLFSAHNLDAFGTPAMSGLVSLSAFAGATHLSVPMGFDQNQVPVGLLIFGRPQQEATVIRVGYDFNQRTMQDNRRQPPGT